MLKISLIKFSLILFNITIHKGHPPILQQSPERLIANIPEEENSEIPEIGNDSEAIYGEKNMSPANRIGLKDRPHIAQILDEDVQNNDNCCNRIRESKTYEIQAPKTGLNYQK